VTDIHGPIKTDLQEVLTRNTQARDIIGGLAAARPALAGVFHFIETALADTVALAAEISTLRADLAELRLERANLAAAARAAIGAYLDGDYDPLAYLRDELAAQGYGPERGRG
jgi:hypothetical protein